MTLNPIPELKPEVAPASAGEGGRSRGLDGFSISDWLAALPFWPKASVAVAAGAIGALAFAPIYFAPALAVTLCAFVWLLDDAAGGPRPIRAGFARGFLIGYGHFLAGTYWVGSAFLQREGAELLAPIGVLGLPAILGVFWGAAGALSAYFWHKGLSRILALATVLFVAELLRGRLFGGLPWNLAGYVWEAGSAMSQIAAWIGAEGLTALTLLLFLTPAVLADRDKGWGERAAPSLIAALVFGLVWGAGSQRLAVAGPARPGPGPVVRVADPGLTQKEKWTEGREWDVVDRYLELTGDRRTSAADIVVWPEGAIPARYPLMPVLEENVPLQSEIGSVLGDRTLIMGANRVQRGEETLVFNTAYVLTDDMAAGDARPYDWRDKHRLTPFGEFIPLFDLISWLPVPSLQQIGAGFTAGAPPEALSIPRAPDGLILICYESIFPELVPRGAGRPGWLVNISVDAWYGDGAGPYQNDNQSRYRALENGLPMARAASGGISSITDPYGRPIVSVGRKGGAAEAALPEPLQETFYARWRPFIAPALLAALAIAAAAAGRPVAGTSPGKPRHD